MSDMPVLDYATALGDLGDDEEIYDEVLETFLDDTPSILNDIKAALDAGKAEDVYRGAHSIKSTSRTIGGMRMGDVCFQLEQSAKAGDISAGKEMLEAIEKEYAVLLDELRVKGKISES